VEAAHLEETTSTLRFATRMMRVVTDPSVNIQYDPQLLVKKYEQEIKDLKAELAMHDTLANRSHIHYDPYTEEQRYDLNQMVKKYLSGQTDDIEVYYRFKERTDHCRLKVLDK
jgi:kinesin family protein 6/9